MRSAIGGWLVLGLATLAQGQATQPADISAPFAPPLLSLQPAPPDSVYAPPSPLNEGPQINQGGVHFELGVAYFTDYVYRGIEVFEPPGSEDLTSLQIDTKLSFDLGKLPHPFIEMFVNYSDSDPVSSFQEIRPMIGLEWDLRPVVLSGGYNTYLYPDRDAFETSEVWGKIQLDDSYFLNTTEPFLSPYIYGAYDYDLYSGWYFEAGVSHDFVLEDLGLVFTTNANVAYVRGFQLFDATPEENNVSGFQHYQFGLIGKYSLNKLLNVSSRFGTWSLQGFLYYTDGIDPDLRATTQVWGGAGVLFQY